MLSQLKVHHVGIACFSIEESKNFYEKIGYKASDITDDPIQDIRICFLEKASELNITAEIDCASIPTCALLDNQLRQLLLLSPNIFRQRVCRPSIDVLPDLSVVRCFSMAQSKRYSLLDFDSERKIFKQFIYDIDLMQNEKCVKACKDCPIYKKYHRRCGCLTFSSFGGSDL